MFSVLNCITLYLISTAVVCVLGDKGRDAYNRQAQEILQKTLKRKDNWNVAKNIILIVGDGMSLPTIAAARVLKSQKAGGNGIGEQMIYETFPHTGLARTYATDKYVPDSASTATAFLCGVKTKYEGVGVDSSHRHADCTSVPGTELRCIGEWAMAEGKGVGLVTNMRVTHATPAPLYAHSPNRWFEYKIKDPSANHTVISPELCTDIARQLVEGYPGKNIQVVLGGGREAFMPKEMYDPEYAECRGKREDQRCLIEAWKQHKKDNNLRHKYVWNKKDFDEVKVKDVDYLLGLFEMAHMHDVTDRTHTKLCKGTSMGKKTKRSAASKKENVLLETEHDEPTLAEMVDKAIGILSKNEKGYFLLVEGGLIDKMHHTGRAVRAVEEALDLENAVRVALARADLRDTLIIVTSDHSQGMNFVGYAEVGTDIFGIAGKANDTLPYTSLMYSSGPGYAITENGREDITGVNTADKDYLQQATIPRSTATHGGEDVGVYATGPMAHLFTGVYDQHYIAHAMAYAACMGRNKDHCGGENPYRSLNGGASQQAGNTRWWFVQGLIVAIAVMIY